MKYKKENEINKKNKCLQKGR